MKILLPPSETKRAGGRPRPLDVAGLALPALAPQREAVVDALVALSADADAVRRVLKLSDRQLADVDHNRMLRTAATMAAVDRYTGVLYDALDAGSLDQPARRWLGRNVLIHSAPFGPVGALDPIPVYRLSAGTSLPGIPPLRRHWSAATSAALGDADFVLDLRSEAYVALGPVPSGVPAAYVRVVTEQGRALNHFNKKSKGELVRTLAHTRPRVKSAGSLLSWAGEQGILLRRTADAGVLELVVAE
ncbi:YaaA family protein [Microbacterium arabinogalactanolyticum]|uniref:YaaA family protein n=1 Tax=Microbacterium arabinogalactanolyticum TaxID=69365 RepID=UPI002554A4D1|nr:peroxide stress protein YaaA [Microbacterium arabinogalactanolyticum]GLC84779.1 peroxide stress protein YaaA [Microbacterium arabinogalactanolyticum]